jgi:hypothetical protein
MMQRDYDLEASRKSAMERSGMARASRRPVGAWEADKPYATHVAELGGD